MDRTVKRPRASAGIAVALATAALALSSLGVGVGVAAATTPAAPAFPDVDPEATLSHFLCYRGKMGGFRTEGTWQRIRVEDAVTNAQFDVAQGLAFCNPVKKQKGSKVLAEISYRRHHLKQYQLRSDSLFITRPVLVRNQFGDSQAAVLGAPFAMFVPTRKFPHRFPAGLDHFVCRNTIVKPLAAQRQLKLTDQFRRYKKMRIGALEQVCFPAVKEHAERTIKPRHRDVHLACYGLSDRSVKFKRLASNQFEKRKRFTAKRTYRLCLPSLVVEDPT